MNTPSTLKPMQGFRLLEHWYMHLQKKKFEHQLFCLLDMCLYNQANNWVKIKNLKNNVIKNICIYIYNIRLIIKYKKNLLKFNEMFLNLKILFLYVNIWSFKVVINFTSDSSLKWHFKRTSQDLQNYKAFKLKVLYDACV